MDCLDQAARVGVLMGGWSAEHDVSLATGRAVSDALKARGHDVVPIIIEPEALAEHCDLVDVLRRSGVDLVFLALHGRLAEDGCIQGLLELAGLPYTGASVLGSALAMDKLKSKEMFLLHNVPTPPYYQVRREDSLTDIEVRHGHFGYPVVVKPRGEGSSLAVTKVHSAGELVSALEAVFAMDDYALVERFITGAEINVGILNGEVLGAIEICPRQGMYDYHAKYTPGASEYHMPARLPSARYQNVLNLARRAVEAVGCEGAVRVDMLVTQGHNEYVLEVNTLPGMTETSLLPKIAAHAGYSFEDLCEVILAGARLYSPQYRHRNEAPRNSAVRVRRGRRAALPPTQLASVDEAV